MGPPTGSRKRNSTTPKKFASKPTNFSKKPTKPNGSILNFFQKTEKEDEALFVGQSSRKNVVPALKQEDEVEPGIFNSDGPQEDDTRFNESGSAVKKRKTSNSDGAENKENIDELFGSDDPDDGQPETQSRDADAKPLKKTTAKRKGPFLDDSDSESDAEESNPKFRLASVLGKVSVAATEKPNDVQGEKKKLMDPGREKETSCPPPPEADTSLDNSLADADDFDDFPADDDDGDDDIGGEEYRMMRYMEEQTRLEAEAGVMGASSLDDRAEPALAEDAMVTNCPICDGSLAGITSDEATQHVNACLDGNPVSLPESQVKLEAREKQSKTGQSSDQMTIGGITLGKRFARAAVPRAGQTNPFETKPSDHDNKPHSAFAQLMSGHAESAAWTSAAAAEQASRGRPAYERRCPFYKIMPNLSVCVDAFRYGAVKGCNAYFLSHFHSDHYIGLTANWTHGPIYCSKVTGDLVKMQLKTAAKWVVSLEFEKTVEIPGTEGATVTMIPANHCPGSSLFLFEKTLGRGPNAKKQRILHCGDFRACPAHVAHPLLQPDVRDAVTGKTRQQKIDICYLDTTYLNPRYTFPPQDGVICACAELCASMSPDPNSTDNVWDKTASKTGTASVSKYFTSTKQDPQPQPPPGNKNDNDNETCIDTADETPTSAATAAFFTNIRDKKPAVPRQRLLVICGTYSIGKERICKAIAQALNTKIFASPAKIRICSMLGDPELTALMTSDPLQAQVHMQMLMEIRAETLRDYLESYKPHFSRIVGFRPSGWNYRPPAASGGSGSSGATTSVNANTSPASVPTTSILHSRSWRTKFAVEDLVPQRGSMREAMCFGVPYSEHSSFRELAMFVMALRIEKVIPTVNVGSEVSRKRMNGWISRWLTERRRGGIVKVLVEQEDDEAINGSSDKAATLWDGKDGRGGGAWW